MRSFLPFLYNRRGKLESFSVEVKIEDRRHKDIPSRAGGKYQATVANLTEVREGREFLIAEIDSAKDDLWGGALGRILLDLKVLLNDSKNYEWREIKKPITSYWQSKQETAINKQKKQKAKTLWTPMGDYTLWKLAEFLTYVLDTKYELLKDDSLFSDFGRKGSSGFEKDFSELVLTPIQSKAEISSIASSRKPIDRQAKEVIDVLTKSKMSFLGPYEDIVDPEFEDYAPFLSNDEERELKALWKIHEEEKQEMEDSKKLSEAERRLKETEFWESPQGKRLNELNSRRVHGGTLTFGERERRKRQRVKEVNKEIENLLFSWEFDYETARQALDYFQYLFEKGANRRWQQEKELREMVDRAKAELGYVKEILQGNWDSNSLTLLGVIIGISASVGFGLASLAPCYKAILGIGGAVVAFIVLSLLLKWTFSRKIILKLMNRILR